MLIKTDTSQWFSFSVTAQVFYSSLSSVLLIFPVSYAASLVVGMALHYRTHVLLIYVSNQILNESSEKKKLASK